MLQMKVSGIALDPFTNTPIVILKDDTNEKNAPYLDRIYGSKLYSHGA